MTYYRDNHSSIPARLNEKGRIALILVIVIGYILVSVFYLIQTNKLVARNFELRAFRDTLGQKQAQNQKLLVSLMDTRSLNNLENTAKNLNLVTVDKIGYLKTTSGFFALSQKP